MPKFNPFGNKNQLLRELLEKLDRDRGGLGLKNKIKNLDQSVFIRQVDRPPIPKEGNNGDTLLYV